MKLYVAMLSSNLFQSGHKVMFSGLETANSPHLRTLSTFIFSNSFLRSFSWNIGSSNIAKYIKYVINSIPKNSLQVLTLSKIFRTNIITVMPIITKTIFNQLNFSFIVFMYCNIFMTYFKIVLAKMIVTIQEIIAMIKYFFFCVLFLVPKMANEANVLKAIRRINSVFIALS